MPVTRRKARLIGLADAAALAMMPYQDAHRALLMGKLRGEKRGSRWFVRLLDAQRLAHEKARERAASQTSAA